MAQRDKVDQRKQRLHARVRRSSRAMRNAQPTTRNRKRATDNAQPTTRNRQRAATRWISVVKEYQGGGGQHQPERVRRVRIGRHASNLLPDLRHIATSCTVRRGLHNMPC
jgi:methylthioribose-1-phosphate isomerase